MENGAPILDFNLALEHMKTSLIVLQADYDAEKNLRDMKIVFINQSMEKEFGLDKKQWVMKRLTDLYPAKDANVLLSKLSEVVRTGESCYVPFFSYRFNRILKTYSFLLKEECVVCLLEESAAENEPLKDRLDSHPIQLTNYMEEVFWVREKDRLIYINKAFEQIVGMPCSTVYRDLYALLDRVDPADRLRVKNMLESDGKNPEVSYHIEFRLNIPFTGLRWVWLRTFSMKGFTLDEPMKAASMIDITERKLMEEELSKKHYQIKALYELFRKSSEHMELDDILLMTQSMIRKYLKVDGTGIYMYDNARKSLHLRSHIGFEKDFLDRIVHNEEGFGYAKSVFETKKGILQSIRDYRSEDGKNILMDESMTYIYSHPIVFGDNILGVLDLIIRQKSSLHLLEQDFIDACCNQLAVLMHNALMFEQLKDELEKRKNAEQEIELIFNTAIDLIAIMTIGGRLVRVSPEWERSLGWSEDELIGRSGQDLVHADDLENTCKAFNKLIHDQVVIGYDNRVKCKNGDYKLIAWNAHQVCEHNDCFIILIGRDMTVHNQIAAKNRELERTIHLESIKMEFFANISHEFRTPLNIIISALQLMQQHIPDETIQYPPHQKVLKHLKSIKQNSFRLLRLVNNLIDITKLDTGYFKIYRYNQDIVNVFESITQSVAYYIEGKGLSLIFDTDVEEKVMAFDPEMIERILLNLLSNSVKYTEKGGLISVHVQDLDDRVRLMVRDTGVGIAPDKLDIIFERFVQGDRQLTRRCEGSGIGLSLVKSMVELHGGRIWVNSTLGKGSTFVVELPVTIMSEEGEQFKNLEPTNEERIHKVNVEFSDIYSINQ